MIEEVKFLFLTNICPVMSIKKLSGGLSNEIYLINNFYIWKVFKNKYLFNHKTEKKIIENSKDHILYYSDNNNICYNFIEGDNITKEYFNENLNDIIQLSKNYHQLKINNIDNFWFDILPSWIKLIPQNSLFFFKNSINKEELINIYNSISKYLEKEFNNLEDDIVLCHHDIHQGNIIKNQDRLFLIDLEFSFKNYYFVDLGNIICELFTDYNTQSYQYHLINDEIIYRVFKIYQNFNNSNLFTQNSNEYINKIKIGIKISHFYWCIWGILVDSFCFNSDINFDYIKFASKRYSQL